MSSANLILKYLIAFIIIAGSAIYLCVKPQDYTPIVQVFFSIFLFIIAYWIGYEKDIEKAQRQANDRWLPQAESVIFRLLTLHTNVKRFEKHTSCMCEQAEKELPELNKDELRAVKTKIKTECELNTDRLNDISHQIEDTIEDWKRFIWENCAGEDCERINEAVGFRKSELESEVR